jgi:hypothetical protein
MVPSDPPRGLGEGFVARGKQRQDRVDLELSSRHLVNRNQRRALGGGLRKPLPGERGPGVADFDQGIGERVGRRQVGRRARGGKQGRDRPRVAHPTDRLGRNPSERQRGGLKVAHELGQGFAIAPDRDGLGRGLADPVVGIREPQADQSRRLDELAPAGRPEDVLTDPRVGFLREHPGERGHRRRVASAEKFPGSVADGRTRVGEPSGKLLGLRSGPVEL